MSGVVYIKEFSEPHIDRKEILRYAGVREETPEISSLLSEALAKTLPCLNYRVCYMRCDVKKTPSGLDLGFCITESNSLSRLLEGSGSIMLFAATVGIDADRLISKYSGSRPSLAVMIDAVCTERIEALADEFMRELSTSSEYCTLELTKRFSPGYGDFPLDMQRQVFAALSPHRHIGLTLGENLLMSPSKSVSAVFGLKKK